MGVQEIHKQVCKQATKANVEEKGEKEPRFHLENKKGKARMKKQGIG